MHVSFQIFRSTVTTMLDRGYLFWYAYGAGDVSNSGKYTFFEPTKNRHAQNQRVRDLF